MSSSVEITGIKEFGLSGEVRAHFLRSIGEPGRKLLRDMGDGRFGPVLRAGEKDSNGRYIVISQLITSKIDKEPVAVRFQMPPFNFFEYGWSSKTNTRVEPARRIITGKFFSMMNSYLQSYVDKAESKVLQKRFDSYES